MKTIASFYSHPPADMLKARLESEGIRVFLKDEFTGNIGSFGFITGGIKVQISEHDLPKVKKIIDEDSEVRDVVFPCSERCPRCASIDIGKKKSMNIVFFVFSLMLFTIPFMFHKPIMKCRTCENEWKKIND